MPLVTPLRRSRADYWQPMSVPGDAQWTLQDARRKSRAKAESRALLEGGYYRAAESALNSADVAGPSWLAAASAAPTCETSELSYGLGVTLVLLEVRAGARDACTDASKAVPSN